MRRSFSGGLLVAVIGALSAKNLAAQETGTPIFRAPYRAFTSYEVGVSLSDPGSNVNYALDGFYAYGHGPYDLSIRGGWEKLSGTVNGVATPCCTRYLLGGDFRARLIQYSESFPLDGALTVGFGANVGSGVDSYYVPVGISIGRRFELEGSKTSFIPYAHPVLIPRFGGGNSSVDFALGLGVDIRFSRSLAIRASGGLGDIDGVGISLAYIR